jgi:hypothetical protein
MTPKIDEKTMVPLGLVATLFAVGIGVTVTGAFWVSKVDDRLARIEDRLGLPRYRDAMTSPISDAWGSSKK